jgi:hypothetical protein
LTSNEQSEARIALAEAAEHAGRRRKKEGGGRRMKEEVGGG